MAEEQTELQKALKYRSGQEFLILEKIRELGLMKSVGCYLNNEKCLISIGESQKEDAVEMLLKDLERMAVSLVTEDALVGRLVSEEK